MLKAIKKATEIVATATATPSGPRLPVIEILAAGLAFWVLDRKEDDATSAQHTPSSGNS